jgi:hypothetical protein
LLVDLILEQPVRDPRARYQLARTLSRLGSSSFLDLQKELASPHPVVSRGVTRQQASVAQDLLQQSDLSGTWVPSVPEKAPVKIPVRALGGAAAVVVVALGAWFLLSGGDASDEGVLEERTERAALSTQQVAERVQPSIVSLTCGQSIGSGFFVTGERLLTNEHVLCPGEETIRVHFPDGRELTGDVISRNADLDIALVEVGGAAVEPLTLGDAAVLSAGEKVVMIGTPLGMDQTVHEGIVSHAARNMFGIAYIQVDANVNPGNSGGPLMNARGQVIGIISMQIQGASGLGFALPINYAYSGELNYVGAPPSDVRRWNAVVQRVQDEERRAVSVAAQSLVQPGVFQASVDRRNVFLIFIVRRSPFMPTPGEEIPYSVMRDGMTVCSGMMFISSWQPMDAASEEASEQPQVQWLRKHGLTKDLYVGGAHFAEESCNQGGSVVGAEFVLDGGDPEYGRTVIVSY